MCVCMCVHMYVCVCVCMCVHVSTHRSQCSTQFSSAWVSGVETVLYQLSLFIYLESCRPWWIFPGPAMAPQAQVCGQHWLDSLVYRDGEHGGAEKVVTKSIIEHYTSSIISLL